MIIQSNPLNIRYSSKNNWKGLIGNQNGFCVFYDDAFCYRAGLYILHSYFRRGILLLEDIIETWAPPSENDTEAYVSYLCSRFKCSRYASMCGREYGLLSAMAQFESGTRISAIEVKYKIIHANSKLL